MACLIPYLKIPLNIGDFIFAVSAYFSIFIVHQSREMINYSKLLKRIDVNELSKVVSKSTIERIKVGANMRLSTLEKICKYLKCQPEDILSIK